MKYRKKPVVIEAFQYVGGGDFEHPALPDWLWNAFEDGTAFNSEGRLMLKTLEGAHTVSDGDYVIRGVQGELYACKPDIFAATYDPVETTPVALGGGSVPA